MEMKTLMMMVMTGLLVAVESRQVRVPSQIIMSMCPDSVDDAYMQCNHQMAEAVSRTLLTKELVEKLSKAWKHAQREFKNKTLADLAPGMTYNHAIAIHVYTREVNFPIYKEFNSAVRTQGRSYRDSFQYKALHFLLADSIRLLQEHSGKQCRWTFRGSVHTFSAHTGRQVRFSSFTSTSLDPKVAKGFGRRTCFQILTCLGAELGNLSLLPREREVLVPPHEKFEVREGQADSSLRECRRVILLESRGLQSNLNCQLFEDRNAGRKGQILSKKQPTPDMTQNDS
ncbi:erythroblast NAD(P)(+)--arginine ADP-ribosyltransferase-like [Lepisosteus oculatus]|uniref:erythroblast NAD(P)(+)--arginine ADP-ribosyltransferase-like n=1 Tax=Lepisosteus oculatus TaxID=7918 RepID=UPI00371E0B41